jgi:hypothetical protein
MNALNSRLYKLEDRLGLGSETFGQLHLRALREAERERLAELGGMAETEDEPPIEAWKEMLLIRRR